MSIRSYVHGHALHRERRVFSPCDSNEHSGSQQEWLLFLLCSDHDVGYCADGVFTTELLPERLRPLTGQCVCVLCVLSLNVCNKCVLLKVWKIALQGPCYMTLLMIAFGLLWGHLLQIRPTQSVFISTCLSLSSTPLVSRFLVGSARGEKEGRW